MTKLFTYLKNFLDNTKFNALPFSTKISALRVHLVMGCFFALYVLVAARLFSVSVLQSEQSLGGLQPRAANLERQDIVDRNGELLATNLNTTALYANPQFITNPEKTARLVTKILPRVSYETLVRRLKSDKTFVWIDRNLTPKEERLINNLGILGISFENNEKRIYPHANLTAHILGYVGVDGSGLAGIEKYMDSYLSSKDSNQPVKLSIDVRVQGVIKEEIQKGMQKFNAIGGVGILQNTNTGEVLALVSLPDYNPNDVSTASDEQLFNKAPLGSYELGSMFKAFTMAMALDSDKIKLNDVYDVTTPIQLSGRQIKDFKGKGGWLSVPEILMYSSNIGMSQIALELGKSKQIGYLKAFGILSATEIELSEKVVGTTVPISKWSDINTVTISYGHGISASPLHLVKTMSAVVNGGKLYQATLLKDHTSTPVQILKESTSEQLKKLLRMVVRFGSGSKAEVPGLFVGGKTGTANKVVNGAYSETERLSSFISAFPINNPKYTLYIMLDNPRPNKESFGYATGGWTSAPITKNVIERIAPLLNIAPDHENLEGIEKSLFVNYRTDERFS